MGNEYISQWPDFLAIQHEYLERKGVDNIAQSILFLSVLMCINICPTYKKEIENKTVTKSDAGNMLKRFQDT